MTDKRYMLYDEKPRVHPAYKMLFLLIPILLIAIGYGVYDYLGGSRVGSSSKLGEVYATRFCGQKYYVWYLRDRNGNLLTHGMTDDKPYIFEQGDTVSIMFSDRGIGLDLDYWTDTYDLTQNPAVELAEPAQRPQFDPLTYTRHKSFPAVDTGSKYVPAKDISLNGHELYHWALQAEDGEVEWFEGSNTLPVAETADDCITVRYTGYDDLIYASNVEGQPYLMYFWPEDGYYSYDYAEFENGTVLVEQAIGNFSNYKILFDDWQEKTDGFVNTEPVDDPENFYGCIKLYERAKAEVTKPYSLVTFRVDMTIGENPQILLYEITFTSDPDDPAAATTVYMTPDGVTTRVLDGSPYPEE